MSNPNDIVSPSTRRAMDATLRTARQNMHSLAVAAGVAGARTWKGPRPTPSPISARKRKRRQVTASRRVNR